MTPSEADESRIRGYLYVLGRSLRAFLTAELAADATREVESHIRERIGEGKNVEEALAELGPPLRVAQAYSHEMTLDEAETTARLVPMLRAMWHLATTSVYGFAWGVLVLVGWAMSLSLLAVAVLKPIFPGNVGLIVMNGGIGPGLHVIAMPRFSIDIFGGRGFTYGAMFPLPPGAEVHGGYWVVPISILAALLVAVLTHSASRRVLGWLRSRKSPGRLRVRVVVDRG